MIYSDFRQMKPNTKGFSLTFDNTIKFYNLNVPLNQETF